MMAISIGSITISSYYLMLILGTAGMFYCLYNRRAIFSLNVGCSAAFTVLLTLVGVTGAMLLYYLEAGSFGGVSFFGSVYLIPIIMPIVGLFFHLKPWQSMDICGPCVAIMIGCLRFNCVLNGCCGGWQVCIGNQCFAWPTQAIDSIGDFAILIWLLHLEKKEEAKGKLYPIFMIAYSSMRFFLEFLRNTPKDWIYLSHGQWFSLISIIAGTLWIAVQKQRDTAL